MSKTREFFLTRPAAVLVGLLFVIVIMSTMGVKADQRPGAMTNPWQILPQAIPTTPTQICRMVGSSNQPPCGRDLYVCTGDVSADPNASIINVTITDNQSSPIPYWSTVPISGVTSTTGAGYKLFDASMDNGCRMFPKGIIVTASATGAYISMSGKY